MGLENITFGGVNISVGIDADKAISPAIGAQYVASDTEKFYVCYLTGTWNEITPTNNATSTSGTYTGNDTVNRAIAHGLGEIPSFVIIVNTVNAWLFTIINSGQIKYTGPSSGGVHAVTAADSTNFYVGNASSFGDSANSNTTPFYWVAIA